MLPIQQPMYRPYPPGAPPQRSPHGSATRRGHGGPMMATSHPQAGPTPAQIQAQQAAIAQHQDLAKRRSRKPADKNIPDGLEQMVEGDMVQQYKALRDLERRMDAAMMRKKIDIGEAVNKNAKRYKTLRIWISNTVENQPWQDRTLDENTFDFSTGSEASYRVRIEGRILDEDEKEEGEEEHIEDEGKGNEGKKTTENSKSDDDDRGEPMEHDGGGQDQDQAIDPSTEQEKRNKNSKMSKPPKKFSHLLKSITIDFPEQGGGNNNDTLHHHHHQQQQSQSTQIEWRKPLLPPTTAPNPPSASILAAADFDALFFERKSDENIPITINIVLDENPERFRLSPELARLLDTDEGDRASVVLGVWDYIKTVQLQEDDERRTIRCDAALKSVFHRDQIYFPHIPDHLSPHLHPLAPIQLPYTIRVDQAYHTTMSAQDRYTIYDIPLHTTSADHNDPLRSRMMKLLQSSHPPHPDAVGLLRVMNATDDQLATLVQAMNQSRAKHAFFVEMSKNPVTFVRRWLGSQKRDLSVILGESNAATRREMNDGDGDGVDGSDDAGMVVGGGGVAAGGSRNGVWTSQEVRELVGLWLAR